MKSRVLVMDSGEVRVEDIDLREPGTGEVLVESCYSGISPGTELRCLAGKQAGGTGAPFVPGYALTGKVVASRSPEIKEGTRVFTPGSKHVGNFDRLWGGHVSHAVCDAEKTYPLPDGVSMKEGSMAALGAIAMHGVRRAGIKADEKVFCLGLGPIGQFSSRIAKALGAEVYGCDLSHARVSAAARQGIKAHAAGTAGLEEIRSLICPEGVDAVMDATGVPSLVPQALEFLKDLPWDNSEQVPNRYVIQGSYPGEFSIGYNQVFFKEVVMHIPRNYQLRDMRLILSMINDKAVVASDLAGDVFAPEDCMRAYELVKDRDLNGSVLFKWSEEVTT